MTLKSAIPGRMYTADAVSCEKSAKMRLASVGIVPGTAILLMRRSRGGTAEIYVRSSRIAIGARLASAVFLRPAAPPSDERRVSASCPGTLPRPQCAGAGLRRSAAEGGRKK